MQWEEFKIAQLFWWWFCLSNIFSARERSLRELMFSKKSGRFLGILFGIFPMSSQNPQYLNLWWSTAIFCWGVQILCVLEEVIHFSSNFCGVFQCIFYRCIFRQNLLRSNGSNTRNSGNTIASISCDGFIIWYLLRRNSHFSYTASAFIRLEVSAILWIEDCYVFSDNLKQILITWKNDDLRLCLISKMFGNSRKYIIRFKSLFAEKRLHPFRKNEKTKEVVSQDLLAFLVALLYNLPFLHVEMWDHASHEQQKMSSLFTFEQGKTVETTPYTALLGVPSFMVKCLGTAWNERKEVWNINKNNFLHAGKAKTRSARAGIEPATVSLEGCCSIPWATGARRRVCHFFVSRNFCHNDFDDVLRLIWKSWNWSQFSNDWIRCFGRESNSRLWGSQDSIRESIARSSCSDWRWYSYAFGWVFARMCFYWKTFLCRM